MSYNDIYKKKNPYAVGKGKSAGNCRAISSIVFNLLKKAAVN